MVESIRLTHIDGKVESARVLNYTPILIGSQKDKAFIDLGRESIPGVSHMVKRKVEYAPMFRGDKTSAQHYMDLWQSLKDADIQVVDEVVSISDTEIAETNITADGSKIYGKDTNVHDNIPSPIDDIFKNIDLNEVQKEAVRTAQLASCHHILLSQDHCLDLIVHPDGTWAVIARDIKNTHTNVQYPTDETNIANAEWLVSEHLKKTKEKINKTQINGSQ